MIILGIDPGTAHMGWGVVEKLTAESGRRTGGTRIRVKHIDHGAIKTLPSETLSKRLVLIKREVEELVERHGVSEIIIERVIFNVNKRSAISVAQSYGVILLLAGERDLPVYEYNALEAKLHLAGYGRASKKDVQLALKRRLRLKVHPTPVHASDALAIALCHIFKRERENARSPRE